MHGIVTQSGGFDPSVLRLAERALRDVGYRVLVAQSAHQAMEIASAFEGRIDAIVTDVVMPGMSGPTLATWLELGRPDIRVLYILGYTNDMMEQRGILQEGKRFLRKPFTPEEIARALRDVLDQACMQNVVLLDVRIINTVVLDDSVNALAGVDRCPVARLLRWIEPMRPCRPSAETSSCFRFGDKP